MFRGLTYLIIVPLMSVLLLAGCSSEKNEDLPNVVVILTDDLGYGDLGVYGNQIIKTPNIDRMANEGVRFTNAYASSSNCTPSRAGLLTGRYPIRSGLAHQVIFVPDTHGLPVEEVTIADMLKPLGYNTAVIGKWHLGHTPEFWPTEHGFDYYYGLPYSNNQSPLALYRNKTVLEDDVDQRVLTANYTKEAITFIEKNRDRPFFLYLSHTFPHVPLYVSEKFEGKSDASLYGDVVEELDWSTGEVLKAIKRLGLEKKTLVIFTSDNGPYQGGNTAGLRGTKGTAWEGGYRVPFVAWWPDNIPAGVVSEGISMNIDILPTIQKITGADLPSDVKIDGKNIMPMLKGEQKSPHEKLYFFSDERIAGVRTPRWKMVLRARYRGIERWLPEHDVNLLFDMEKDSHERYSVMNRHPDVWERMMGYFNQGVTEFYPLALHLKEDDQ